MIQAFFVLVCHFDEGEITLEIPQSKLPIFIEILV